MESIIITNAETLVIPTRCDCGATMAHVEWEGMMGWLCPNCDNFIPDPYQP